MNCVFCEADIGLPETDVHGHSLVGCPKCFNPLIVDQQERNSSVTAVANEDLRSIVPKGSVLDTMLHKAPELVAELPVMDDVFRQVFIAINDPMSDSATIAKSISEDAALTMRVLKLVNSAYYKRGEEITSLDRACSHLGLRQIGQITSACAAEKMFRCPDKDFAARAEIEWCHALATALCMEKIEFVVDAAVRDDMYLGALLHNIGRVVLLNLMSSDRFGSTVQLRQSPKNIDRILDTYAGIMSLQVARLNELPPLTAAGIYYYQDPKSAPVKEWKSGAHALAFAEHFAQLAWPTPQDDMKVEDLDPQLVALGEYFGMGTSRIMEILEANLPEVREFIVSHTGG